MALRMPDLLQDGDVEWIDPTEEKSRLQVYFEGNWYMWQPLRRMIAAQEQEEKARQQAEWEQQYAASAKFFEVQDLDTGDVYWYNPVTGTNR